MIFKALNRGAAATLAAAALAAGLAVTGTTASAQEVTLRVHTFVPPPSNPVKTFLEPWAEKVGKDSDGRIKVQVFSAMQLGGGAPQLLDQVRDGVVDIVWALPGFTPGRMPRVEPFELPFVHKDPVSTVLALQDYQDKHLGEELAEYHPLLLHSHAGFLIQTKAPVTKLADLKGMKIRAAARSGVWLLESAGATGLGLPLPEIPQALSKGVIDGVTLPYEIAPAIKMQDLVSNFSTLAGPQPRLGTNVFAFLMNRDSYDDLPADLKKVIDANAGRNIARSAGENWAAIEEPARAVMASKEKNSFHTIPPEEVEKFRAAAEPVFERWYAEMDKLGIDGKALVADARAMIDKHSN